MPNVDAMYRYHAFISHNGAQKPWVRQIVARLRGQGLSIFFDEDCISLGEDIVKAIESGLRHSRHTILVLSPEAIASPWVELEWCTSVYRSPGSAARHIIPVLRSDCEIPILLARLKYLDARGDQLDDYVNRLIAAIDMTAEVERPAPPTERSFESVNGGHLNIQFTIGGTVDPRSDLYVERQSDQILRTALISHSGLVVVWGARQTGKSSMVGRALHHAAASDRRIGFVDFSGVGGNTAEQVYYGACRQLADDFEASLPQISEFRQFPDPLDAFFKFLERLPNGSVVAFDEVDYLRSVGQLDRFFIRMRAVYESRYSKKRNVPFFIVASFLAPHELIENSSSSPFNVGELMQLTNFTIGQASRIFERAGANREQISQLYELTGGQPYLVQVTARLLSEGILIQQVYEQCDKLDGPYANHLHSLKMYLEDSPSSCKALRVHLSGVRPQEADLVRLFDRGILKRAGTELEYTSGVYRRFISRML